MRSYLLIPALCLWLSASAQQKTITLFATTHQIDTSLETECKKAIQKIVSLRPNLICIESIPVWDSTSMVKIKHKQLTEIRSLKLQLGLSEKNIRDSIHLLKQSSITDAHTLARLAFFLYLAGDPAGNTFYYWFRALQAPGGSQLKDSLLRRYAQKESNSEYNRIVFPAAAQLGMDEVYGVDDRSDHPEDIRTQQQVQSLLMQSDKGKQQLTTYMKTQADYNASLRSQNLLRLLNDSTYQNQISTLITDTYPSITEDIAAKRMKTLWEKRNRTIALRIKEIIRSNPGADNILVSFGAAHIPLLKKYLEEILPQFQVRRFSF